MRALEFERIKSTAYKYVGSDSLMPSSDPIVTQPLVLIGPPLPWPLTTPNADVSHPLLGLSEARDRTLSARMV